MQATHNIMARLLWAQSKTSCGNQMKVQQRIWRSCIVAILAKVFLRRTKVALFLHYPENVHVLDKILTNIMSYFSNELWADSKATFSSRISA